MRSQYQKAVSEVLQQTQSFFILQVFRLDIGASDFFSEIKIYRIGENRPVKNKGMEFSILSARIHLLGQVCEQLIIDHTAAERKRLNVPHPYKPIWI